jgi:hypothetical protein
MNLIPSDRISMRDVDHPVIGSDGITMRMMFPGEEHTFDRPVVAEVPVKGLFALMSQDMMANGTLPTGKPKPLLDTGEPAPTPPAALTPQQRLDAFLVAHPEARGTKWEQKGREMVEQGKVKMASPAKGTPLIFKNGGEMNKNEFLTTLARIAAKKAKVPMTMLPPAPMQGEGHDVLEYLQQGGQFDELFDSGPVQFYTNESGERFATTGSRHQSVDGDEQGYKLYRDKMKDNVEWIQSHGLTKEEFYKRYPDEVTFNHKYPLDFPYRDERSYQQGGQVPQEIIDMYLAQQGQDHWGRAATGFKGALDDLLGSAYQTQRDKVRVEDFDPSVQTAQDGAEVPAYIRRNRYRGYTPNYQNPIDLHYQGADEGLTHPGVIAPINWGQSTLGSYDVKYRNPIWGKNVKRREHYEFYTPYSAASQAGKPVSPNGVRGTATSRLTRNVPAASTAIDESPFRAQPHVNLDYQDDGAIPFMGDMPGVGRPSAAGENPGKEMSLAQARRTMKKYGYLLGSDKSQDTPEAMSVRKAKRVVDKYSYLNKPVRQMNLRPGMEPSETDQMLRQREEEYRQLQQRFKKGGSVEDRLKIASEFYRKGGMKC